MPPRKQSRKKIISNHASLPRRVCQEYGSCLEPILKETAIHFSNPKSHVANKIIQSVKKFVCDKSDSNKLQSAVRSHLMEQGKAMTTTIASLIHQQKEKAVGGATANAIDCIVPSRPSRTEVAWQEAARRREIKGLESAMMDIVSDCFSKSLPQYINNTLQASESNENTIQSISAEISTSLKLHEKLIKTRITRLVENQSKGLAAAQASNAPSSSGNGNNKRRAEDDDEISRGRKRERYNR